MKKEIVQKILETYASYMAEFAQSTCENGHSALHLVVGSKIAKLLLTHKEFVEQINAKNSLGQTALDVAIFHNSFYNQTRSGVKCHKNYALVVTLLDYGATYNEKTASKNLSTTMKDILAAKTPQERKSVLFWRKAKLVLDFQLDFLIASTVAVAGIYLLYSHYLSLLRSFANGPTVLKTMVAGPTNRLPNQYQATLALKSNPQF